MLQEREVIAMAQAARKITASVYLYDPAGESLLNEADLNAHCFLAGCGKRWRDGAGLVGSAHRTTRCGM
jgi:hypothetical protein